MSLDRGNQPRYSLTSDVDPPVVVRPVQLATRKSGIASTLFDLETRFCMERRVDKYCKGKGLNQKSPVSGYQYKYPTRTHNDNCILTDSESESLSGSPN
jgi:hypothetical protein